jgi:hypothetical protein
MVKCTKCKYNQSSTGITCYKKHILNEFTGEWEYRYKSDKNDKGQCKDFRRFSFIEFMIGYNEYV